MGKYKKGIWQFSLKMNFKKLRGNVYFYLFLGSAKYLTMRLVKPKELAILNFNGNSMTTSSLLVSEPILSSRQDEKIVCIMFKIMLLLSGRY